MEQTLTVFKKPLYLVEGDQVRLSDGTLVTYTDDNMVRNKNDDWCPKLTLMKRDGGFIYVTVDKECLLPVTFKITKE